ncbi:MAG: radical SAM protein, partial [Elusimicrobiota bacterium]
VSRVRITGGEPLVRRGLPELLGRVASVAGIEEVSLSTNGLLLGALAADLARAGLRRVNISLDTLREGRFRDIAGGASTPAGAPCRTPSERALAAGADGLHGVMDGLRAALAAGLCPVKLNVVVARGLNDDEVPDFVRLARVLPVHVRFIELMPIGWTGFFTPERWVPIDEIKRGCGSLLPLGPGEGPEGSGPAAYFRSPGAQGTVGFIGALTEPFCGRCNRVRLTSSGRLLSCLAQEGEGTDLGAMLRAGARPELIRAAIREAVRSKPPASQPPYARDRGPGDLDVRGGRIACPPAR